MWDDDFSESERPEGRTLISISRVRVPYKAFQLRRGVKPCRSRVKRKERREYFGILATLSAFARDSYLFAPQADSNCFGLSRPALTRHYLASVVATVLSKISAAVFPLNSMRLS